MDAQKQSIRFQTLHHVWDQRFKNPNDLCQCKVVTQRMNCVLRRNQTFASPIKIKLGHDLFSLFFFLSVSWFSTLTIKVWDLIFFFFGREQIKPEEDEMGFFPPLDQDSTETIVSLLRVSPMEMSNLPFYLLMEGKKWTSWMSEIVWNSSELSQSVKTFTGKKPSMTRCLF